MKRLAVGLAVVLGFLVGYGGIAKAWPGVPDRDKWHGYFTNILDDQGNAVINGGYPNSVNNANAFISFVEGKLRSGTARDKVGAAFTIQTMRGATGGWSRNNPPTAYELADWESRVRYADSQGWIQWFANFTFSGNSYWQGDGGGGPNPNDDAFYYENGVRLSIIFHDPNAASGNGVAYVIKRDCGNPLTNGYMPGLHFGWTGTGRTTVPAQAVPGQTVTFSHYVKDQGPNTALMYWQTRNTTNGGSGVVAQGGPLTFLAGQEINVNNENFTIPSNAAAGTKYCRDVGWFWSTSTSGAWGYGSDACVTVYIPAKLKAAMSVAPTTMQAGDTATFSPKISAVTNGSPVTGVTCTNIQKVYDPSGAQISTSSLPCTDSAGNSPFTVPTGGVVLLKTNTYTAPDNIAVGSKICQTLTITNPTLPAYYNSYPADATDTQCVVIAKSPYVQFLGGDVWAGGGFAALGPCTNGANITTVTRSHALADGTTPGSGAAYAAFALGRVTTFGSASMALVTTTGVGKAWTFSNNNVATLGNFGASPHCIPDYVSQYQSLPPQGGGTFDMAGGNQQRHIVGNATLHGGIGNGIQKLFLVEGDVTIDNDITYPANYGNGSSIPSIVVIATGNIYVNAGVKQLDGIFITRKTFYTCWPKTEPATTGICNNQLVINGSVSANAVDLFRTAGAEGATPAQQKQSAETFNMSPEMFLNNALDATTQAVITTSNVRELPPRF